MLKIIGALITVGGIVGQDPLWALGGVAVYCAGNHLRLSLEQLEAGATMDANAGERP